MAAPLPGPLSAALLGASPATDARCVELRRRAAELAALFPADHDRTLGEFGPAGATISLIDLSKQAPNVPTMGSLPPALAVTFRDDGPVAFVIVTTAFSSPPAATFDSSRLEPFRTLGREGYVGMIDGRHLDELADYLHSAAGVDSPSIQIAVSSTRLYITDIDLRHGLYYSPPARHLYGAAISPALSLAAFCQRSESGDTFYIGNTPS